MLNTRRLLYCIWKVDIIKQVEEDSGMKIQNLKINNFMLFEETSIDWSKNINVIFGENSTGKTTLLKLMYSVLKPLGKNDLTQMPKELTEKCSWRSCWRYFGQMRCGYFPKGSVADNKV